MGLPLGAFRFRKYYYLEQDSDGAIVLSERKQLVGFLRFDHNPDSRVLQACGTWVDPAYRRQGLATRMWRFALRSTGTTRISVYTATNAGVALVKALAHTRGTQHALQSFA